MFNLNIKRRSAPLSFSQIRIKNSYKVKIKSHVFGVCAFCKAFVFYVFFRAFDILILVKNGIRSFFLAALNIQTFLIRRLIWSRGRLGGAFANILIIFLALSVFLVGGVFQSSFVSASNTQTEYITGSNDILPERVLTKTEIPPDRIREDYIEYVVESGDSLSSIGQRFGVSIDSIRYANNLVSLDYLKTGQKLLIPPVSGVIHTVKSGDTLTSLASKYAVPTQAIADVNYLDGPPFDLSVGQKLIIPGAKIPALVVPSAPAAVLPQYGLDAYGTIPYANTGVSGSGQFLWPARYHVITQYFSWYHPAIDIAQSPSPIYASDSGTVIRAGWWTNGYGFAVQIDHGNGYVTTYAHMVRIDVSVGQEVGRGEILGEMGSTGRSTGPHVHFSVQYNGRYIDPLSVL